MSPLIVHVIPYDAVGGVEVAAASVDAGTYDGFRLRKAFIAEKGHGIRGSDDLVTGARSENDPRAYASLALQLIRLRPQALVLSLWRSCIVGLLVKAVRPRTRLILFLHNTRDAHRVDHAITRLTARLSDEIWADSASSAAERLGATRRRVRAISFLVDRPAPVTDPVPSDRFIFWGRLHPRKRIDVALRFFALFRSQTGRGRFDIIGPDGGAGSALRGLVRDLNLDQWVTFHDAMPHEEIALMARRCSFFVQTSAFEGMAMAVAEAMQLGLVPLVTPVGEIERYVSDGESGLWFDDPQHAVTRVAALIDDEEAFAAMRTRAIRHWQHDVPLYRDSFLRACAAIADRVRGPGDQRPSTRA